eukprot:gene34163-44136_t
MLATTFSIANLIVSVSSLYHPPPTRLVHLSSTAAMMTRATNVDNITINGQFTLEEVEVSVLSDLSPANYYESQILSALKNWKGERLSSYLLPREGDYINLYQMRDEFNEEQTAKSFFSPIKSKQLVVGASVECDLYFKPDLDSDTDFDISSFLSGAVLDLHKISDKVECESMDGKWVYVEISQGPQFLLQKLWQLERAVRILPPLDVKFNPSYLVVLLNGDEKEARFAIENIRVPAQAKILQYPLFIGWTPTRNIFKLLGNLQTGQEQLEKGQEQLETELGDIKVLLEQVLFELLKKK